MYSEDRDKTVIIHQSRFGESGYEDPEPGNPFRPEEPITERNFGKSGYEDE